jgi:hypothetical protein
MKIVVWALARAGCNPARALVTPVVLLKAVAVVKVVVLNVVHARP